MKRLIRKLFVTFEACSGRWWYDPMVGFFAAADAFVIFISVEALLIAKIVVQPTKWIVSSLWAALGSALGATALATLISRYGEPIVNRFFPGALASHAWVHTTSFLGDHGLLGLGLIAFGPIPQHIGVAISGLAHMAAAKVFWAIFIGRTAKYFLITWAVKHSPKLLKKFKIIPTRPVDSEATL
jgi:membrane protein YqaA with SNARE-associated domain